MIRERILESLQKKMGFRKVKSPSGYKIVPINTHEKSSQEKMTEDLELIKELSKDANSRYINKGTKDLDFRRKLSKIGKPSQAEIDKIARRSKYVHKAIMRDVTEEGIVMEGNNPFKEGQEAKKAGKTLKDNPYFTGEFTKLGTPKLSEDGHEWNDGYGSIGRKASDKEVADAANLDVSRFRKKPNKYYR